jgi:hypothetical protein
LVLVQFSKESRLFVHERFSGRCCHFGVRLEATIAADMQGLVPVFSKDSADEESPVAVRGIFFAAHEGNFETGDAVLHAFDRRDEGVVFCDAAIEHMTGRIVVVRILWASAQFAAEKKILDAGFDERFPNKFVIELRCEARVRRRACVDDDIHLVSRQQFKKLLE